MLRLDASLKHWQPGCCCVATGQHGGVTAMRCWVCRLVICIHFNMNCTYSIQMSLYHFNVVFTCWKLVLSLHTCEICIVAASTVGDGSVMLIVSDGSMTLFLCDTDQRTSVSDNTSRISCHGITSNFALCFAFSSVVEFINCTDKSAKKFKLNSSMHIYGYNKRRLPCERPSICSSLLDRWLCR